VTQEIAHEGKRLDLIRLGAGHDAVEDRSGVAATAAPMIKGSSSMITSRIEYS
jgi:hypothetical protein